MRMAMPSLAGEHRLTSRITGNRTRCYDAERDAAGTGRVAVVGGQEITKHKMGGLTWFGGELAIVGGGRTLRGLHRRIGLAGIGLLRGRARARARVPTI